MKLSLILLLALILTACNRPIETPTPSETPNPGVETFMAEQTHTIDPTWGYLPSHTPTPLNPVFQTATPLRETRIAEGTEIEPTSSIYDDATRYAQTKAAFQETATRYPLYQTATAHAVFLNSSPTAEVFTPEPTPEYEAWQVVVETLNIRPDCNTNAARIGTAARDQILATLPGAVNANGFEWRRLAASKGCIAVRAAGGSVYAREIVQ